MTPDESSETGIGTQALLATRRALHAVAEVILAGPQYRTSGTIELRVAPGGFATVAAPHLRVSGADLVVGDETHHALSGRTIAEVAARAGVRPGGPGVYPDASDVDPSEALQVDPVAAGWLARCYAAGDAALRRLKPQAVPVLWPEHFDVGITVDQVNYGVSPGDGTYSEPYAYVGPWQPRTGSFWNAPFGAHRSMRDIGSSDAVFEFFSIGRRRASEDAITSPPSVGGR